ncbi:dTDP-L-rhamnose 4-epimerase [Kribbella antiqua]|uniref:dTDP-L-rhamnose 4-epimerase n=1 Tax=Kribbella antiqua TaxID=2512217 RepID=A0A4R2IE90_9ACTN|nr:NAD-dependent epimerase/dehydratase family protein [Kribbella antiqua]TCO42492.1 dTDP-L-rhamnose 4-epimerase [Kribbella antiqua]
MKVLLTGGAGFIGRPVLAQLVAGGHDVTVFDSLRADVHDQPPAVQNLVVADVRDADAVTAALAGVDVVVHLAAKVGLGVDLNDIDDYVSSNSLGTAVLLRQMGRLRIEHLVYASSMVVYGEGRYECARHGRVAPGPRRIEDLAQGDFEPPCPYCGEFLQPGLVDEDACPDPRNAYAASKLTGEHLASAWARETGGRVAALRFHNVYGPGMPRNTPYAGVAALFRSSLERGEPPQVFEDGRQRRDFVHVRDVASAVAAAAVADHPQVAAYNVGSGTVHTIGELAAELSRAYGGPAPVITGRFRLGDVRHITASSDRIKAELGWKPSYDLAAGIASTVSEPQS